MFPNSKSITRKNKSQTPQASREIGYDWKVLNKNIQNSRPKIYKSRSIKIDNLNRIDMNL